MPVVSPAPPATACVAMPIRVLPVASLLVSGGASLEMIGRLLGHTQIGTTQRYAHLIDAPLRAGVNAVGEMLKPRLRVVGE